MWKSLTRGLRAPFERGPWSNRTSSGEQTSAPNPQDSQFNLPCPFKLLPCLLGKCQTYPFVPFRQGHKQNHQGTNSEGRSDESCKNETLHHQPCAILGAVGWSGVLVLGWTILQPWYRHDKLRHQTPSPNLHNDLQHSVNAIFTPNRYSSLYRLLLHPALSQPIQNNGLPHFSSSSSSTSASSSVNSSTQTSLSSSSLCQSSSDSSIGCVEKDSLTSERQLTPDEAFNEAAEEVRRIHERVVGASENRLGVSCMSLSQNRQAIEHFRAASNLHYAPAAFNLGQCYELGIGTEQDFSQAAHWYQKASDLGHPTAMYNLGVFYAHGWGGLVADSNHARQLFTHAAMLGQPEAQAALNLKVNTTGTAENHSANNQPTKKSDTFSSFRDFLDFPKFSSLSRRKEIEINLQNSSSIPTESSSSVPSSSTSSTSSSSYDHALSFRHQSISPIKESSETYSDTSSSDDEWEITSNLDSLNGNSATLYRLAYYYEHNSKEEQDPKLVLQLYEMAADHGHVKAKRYLEVLERHKASGTLDDFLKRRRNSRTSSSSMSERSLKN